MEWKHPKHYVQSQLWFHGYADNNSGYHLSAELFS